MVITRNYAAKNNIELHEGLPLKKRKNSKNEDTHYIFRFLILILMFTLMFTLSTLTYHYLFEKSDKSIYNFIITDLPEKTIVKLYNNIPAIPARPYNEIPDVLYNEIPAKTYNYILDMFQDYNIDYF
jgi:hypothetical protein